MKSNIGKYHLIVSKNDTTIIEIGDFQLKLAVVKSCWVLSLTINLILIVMLTIYPVKQIKNSELLPELHLI